MSGRPASHLQRRGGIFHFRMRVPRDLKLRLGLSEVRCSLRTYSVTTARLLAAIYSMRVKEAFVVIQCRELSKEDGLALVRAICQRLIAEVDGGVIPITNNPQRELAALRDASRERVVALTEQLDRRQFCPEHLEEVRKLVSQEEIAWDELPEVRQHDILEGLARARIERERAFQIRLQDRLIPIKPTDPLFQFDIACTSAPAPLAPAQTIGPTVGDAIRTYLLQGEKKWTPKTVNGRRPQLRYLEDHLGTNRPLASITPHEIREYRDAICRLRSRHHRSGARSFAERQTNNPAHRIQPKTAALIFETCKAFFTWATVVEGYIETSPAENVRLDMPKRSKSHKSRRAFTAAELRTLFSAPLFRGHKSAKRWSQAGARVIRDDYFWIPVLGFYTGARLGEIVQLHIGDVRLDDDVPNIEITDTPDDGSGSGDKKHVKSAAGIRAIPVHPDILELGFAEFVARRAKDGSPSTRLFNKIKFGEDGQASSAFSKWFSRFMDKVGLKNPALVFHSFRHNAQDAFREALQPQYVIDRILGHSNGATSAGYGQGISLETAGRAVRQLKLLIRLPEFWGERPRLPGDAQ